MLYYYLDGLDKKGPYTVEELRARNVTFDTMVFTEGMANWEPIHSLPELSEKLFPTTHEHVSEETQLENVSSEEKVVIEAGNNKAATSKKIIIPSILFLIIGVLAAVGFSYLYLQRQKEKDLQLMEKKIEEVFQGKDEVCDHKITGVTGELKKADWLTPADNEGKQLVEYYDCSSGGFTVLTLSKKPNGYDLVENYSKNMGYKIPASRWTPGTDYGYGFTTPGYSTPTYRQSIQTAYKEAMEYLSSEKENKCFSAGSYDRIKTFDEIHTDYFYIHNVAPTKYSSASNFFKSWKSAGDAMVFNNQWIVWYAYEGNHYEVTEDKKVFTKKMIIYSFIGSVLAVLIYLLLRYRRRIALQVT